MKKKIVALLLVLVLSMAMMVPAFAAPTACRAGCNSYVPQSYGPTWYESNNNGTHDLKQVITYVCTGCAQIASETVTIRGGENCYGAVSNKCVYCGYKLYRSVDMIA